MLAQQGIYNDFSPELRKELEAQVESFGKRMRVKFDIAKPNPDPQKYNGAIIYPFTYTLDPKTFKVTDPYEKREGKQKVKSVGIIKTLKTDATSNVETSFFCIRLNERVRGVLDLDLEVPEQAEQAMYVLIHPKLAGGKFADKQKTPVMSIVNEAAFAKEQRTNRTAKKLATDYAFTMSEQDVMDFADAMNWEREDEGILRNKIEELAETTPAAFNDLVKGELLKVQAVVKKALDNKIISYDPLGNRVLWVSTGQPLAQLSGEEDKNEVQKIALWFHVGGDQAKKAFDKVKSLMGSKEKVS